MSQRMTGNADDWLPMTMEERTRHCILFYSQAPLHGLLSGEKARDLFLTSRLPLPQLSQIWNLADLTADNIMDLQEFCIAMRLLQSCLRGQKLPQTLPDALMSLPTDPTTQPPPTVLAITPAELQLYDRLFLKLDLHKTGFLDANIVRDTLLVSAVAPDQLSMVWNMCDIDRDGRINQQEFAIICHLVRHLKKGNALDVCMNVFSVLPQIAPSNTWEAQTHRMKDLTHRKHKLMAFRERRKREEIRENRRLELERKKLELVQLQYQSLKEKGLLSETENQCEKVIHKSEARLKQMEAVTNRLHREHELARQDAAHVIMEEQKLANDVKLLQDESDSMRHRQARLGGNRRATREIDPFHQLYEQKKEERISGIRTPRKENPVHIPFKDNPFDKDFLVNGSYLSGEDIFLNNSQQPSAWNSEGHIADNNSFNELTFGFKDNFLEIWDNLENISETKTIKEVNGNHSAYFFESDEEDPVFNTVSVTEEEDDLWCLLTNKQTNHQELSGLQNKMADIQAQLQQLNKEGAQLIFRQPSNVGASKDVHGVKTSEETFVAKELFPETSVKANSVNNEPASNDNLHQDELITPQHIGSPLQSKPDSDTQPEVCYVNSIGDISSELSLASSPSPSQLNTSSPLQSRSSVLTSTSAEEFKSPTARKKSHSRQAKSPPPPPPPLGSPTKSPPTTDRNSIVASTNQTVSSTSENKQKIESNPQVSVCDEQHKDNHSDKPTAPPPRRHKRGSVKSKGISPEPPTSPQITPTPSPIPATSSPIPTALSPLPRELSPIPPQSSPLPRESSPLPPQSSILPRESSPLPPQSSTLPRELSPLPGQSSPIPPKSLPISSPLSPLSPSSSPLPPPSSPTPSLQSSSSSISPSAPRRPPRHNKSPAPKPPRIQRAISDTTTINRTNLASPVGSDEIVTSPPARLSKAVSLDVQSTNPGQAPVAPPRLRKGSRKGRGSLKDTKDVDKPSDVNHLDKQNETHASVDNIDTGVSIRSQNSEKENQNPTVITDIKPPTTSALQEQKDRSESKTIPDTISKDSEATRKLSDSSPNNLNKCSSYENIYVNVSFADSFITPEDTWEISLTPPSNNQVPQHITETPSMVKDLQGDNKADLNKQTAEQSEIDRLTELAKLRPSSDSKEVDNSSDQGKSSFSEFFTDSVWNNSMNNLKSDSLNSKSPDEKIIAESEVEVLATIPAPPAFDTKFCDEDHTKGAITKDESETVQVTEIVNVIPQTTTNDINSHKEVDEKVNVEIKLETAKTVETLESVPNHLPSIEDLPSITVEENLKHDTDEYLIEEGILNTHEQFDIPTKSQTPATGVHNIISVVQENESTLNSDIENKYSVSVIAVESVKVNDSTTPSPHHNFHVIEDDKVSHTIELLSTNTNSKEEFSGIILENIDIESSDIFLDLSGVNQSESDDFETIPVTDIDIVDEEIPSDVIGVIKSSITQPDQVLDSSNEKQISSVLNQPEEHSKQDKQDQDNSTMSRVMIISSPKISSSTNSAKNDKLHIYENDISDNSDDEGFQATFTPKIGVKSVKPDENDNVEDSGTVQLLSYNRSSVEFVDMDKHVDKESFVLEPMTTSSTPPSSEPPPLPLSEPPPLPLTGPPDDPPNEIIIRKTSPTPLPFQKRRKASLPSKLSPPVLDLPLIKTMPPVEEQKSNLSPFNPNFKGSSSPTHTSEVSKKKVNGDESVEKAQKLMHNFEPRVYIRRHGDTTSTKVLAKDLYDHLTKEEGLELERRDVISQMRVKRRSIDSWTRGAEETPILLSPQSPPVDFLAGDVDTKSINSQELTKKHWDDSLESEKDSNKRREVSESEWADGVDVNLKLRKQKYEQDGPIKVAEEQQEEYESAIDREVRLALERENRLKEEQELRQKEKVVLQNQVKKKEPPPQTQKQTMPITKVPPPSKSVHKEVTISKAPPTYHEMTEADRGAEITKRESIIEREIREQQEKEERLRYEKGVRTARHGDKEREQSEYERQEKEQERIIAHESIIEREIRLQQEREEAIQREKSRTKGNFSASYKMSGGAHSPIPASPQPPVDQHRHEPSRQSASLASPSLTQIDQVHYEAAISSRAHPGESLIAKELREMKEREEEFRRIHKHSSEDRVDSWETPASESAVYNVNASHVIPVNSKQNTPQRDERRPDSVHKSSSLDSELSNASDRVVTPNRETRVKVQPWRDEEDYDYERYSSTLRNETPVEREIRLAKEREDDLRKDKGLPPRQVLPDKSIPIELKNNEPVRPSYLFRKGEDDNQRGTMRKISTVRLQKEIESERHRELTLRKEGKISTTSEERVGELMKYVEVIPPPSSFDSQQNKPKGVTPTRSAHKPITAGVDTKSPASKTPLLPQERVIEIVSSEPIQNGGASRDEVDHAQERSRPNENVRVRTPHSQSNGSITRKSYNATESKIEQELREMREREEELRKMELEERTFTDDSRRQRRIINREPYMDVEGKDSSQSGESIRSMTSADHLDEVQLRHKQDRGQNENQGGKNIKRRSTLAEEWEKKFAAQV